MVSSLLRRLLTFPPLRMNVILHTPHLVLCQPHRPKFLIRCKLRQLLGPLLPTSIHLVSLTCTAILKQFSRLYTRPANNKRQMPLQQDPSPGADSLRDVVDHVFYNCCDPAEAAVYMCRLLDLLTKKARAPVVVTRDSGRVCSRHNRFQFLFRQLSTS